MTSFALFINTPEQGAKTQQQIQSVVNKLELPLLVCPTVDSALATMKEQAAAGTKLILFLLGPNLENPVVVARRFRREAPLAHITFLTNGTDTELNQQLKSPVAMIGSYRSIVDLSQENLTERLQAATNSARQRLQLRTTLDRINGQLSSHSRADISKLRRYTVSDRFFANILEHAQDAIIATTNDGIIITWNNAAEKMFDLSQDEAVGRSIVEVGGGDWSEQLPRLIDQIRTSKSGYSRHELIYERPDGRTHTVELMLSLVRDKPGEPIGISTIVRDITERKNLEKQFQQTQKLESLGILAGGIAHDFNNILTGVLVNAELTLIKLPQDSELRQYIEKVQKLTNHAAELSNQMLAYSGKGHFLVQPLDLNQVINEMTHLLHSSISKTAVINYQLSPDLPVIEADAIQIRQVIMNLIINASEAIGDKSGVITISTAAVVCDAEFLAQAHLDNNLRPGIYVCLEVADTGDGMDEATQSKIFDPFYTTKFTGRGLGLAAVLGIVRGHKAAINVQSEEGQGTTFKILFPGSTKMPVQTPEEPLHIIDTFDRQGSVLIIDDEESIREAVREVLRLVGLNTFAAPDGRSGLELFEQTKDELSLVILDLTMPHLDGEAVFTQMFQIKPEVPVLLTSGYDEEEIASRFAGKGLAGFIQKPFSPTSLLAKVKQVLGEN